jgi:hypothetical protein
MSIKLEDIAKETGFSISTVSRVLSNSTYPVSALEQQLPGFQTDSGEGPACGRKDGL